MKRNIKPKNTLESKRVLISWLNNLSVEDYSFLYKMSTHCSLMYNFTLYQIRQSFFESRDLFKETGSYGDILEFKDNYYIVKQNENFSILPNVCSQQILRIAHSDFNSFRALLNKKAKGEYEPDVSIPRYKKKYGETVLSNIVMNGRGARIDKKNQRNMMM